VNYELYMSAALAEARAGAAAGDRPDGAVAVMDDAMVARGREEVVSTGDPTAHAPMVVLREAARRLGRTSLAGLILFTVREPCPMCVGALVESDADGFVYALHDPARGGAGNATQNRLAVVSGIMAAEAAELVADSTRRRS
jgi:tRNA(adenine34) deaminase